MVPRVGFCHFLIRAKIKTGPSAAGTAICHSVQFNLELLEAGLINHYVSAAELINRFTSEMQSAYHAHLTRIALVFGPDVESGWLKRFTNTADTDTRVQWIRSVGSNFAALSVEDVEAQWEAWMRTYWMNRLRSIPVAMTRNEASAMAEWTVTLGRSVPEAVDLAVQHDCKPRRTPSSPVPARGRAGPPSEARLPDRIP